jgi:hypothetical protein
VNLNLLPADLKSEASTPNFVFVTPNLCDDGHDAPCVTGAPGLGSRAKGAPATPVTLGAEDCPGVNCE